MAPHDAREGARGEGRCQTSTRSKAKAKPRCQRPAALQSPAGVASRAGRVAVVDALAASLAVWRGHDHGRTPMRIVHVFARPSRKCPRGVAPSHRGGRVIIIRHGTCIPLLDYYGQVRSISSAHKKAPTMHPGAGGLEGFQYGPKCQGWSIHLYSSCLRFHFLTP